MRDTLVGPWKLMLATLIVVVTLVWVTAVDAATSEAPSCCQPTTTPEVPHGDSRR
jgi:hypothetical protein